MTIPARGKRDYKIVTSAPSPWITVKDAARHLNVGVDAIYEACASKGLKHVKIGHSTIRLRIEWVDEWADSLAKVRT